MSSKPNMQQLREEAESLGLSDEAVAKYCLEQQAIAREDRARERADAASAREHEFKLREQDALEAERIRAHELAMARVNSVNTPQSGSPVLLSESAKLPVFRESEDITSYLIRFERIAALLNVDPDTYAVRLGALLTGKAVDIYDSLPPDITGNYDRLKSSLLLAFRKTHDVYRAEFKNAKSSTNESYEQFVSQLGRKLDFWIDSHEIDKDYDSLREFIIKDQLLACVPSDLRLYLKKRGTVSLDELVILADNWASAHRNRLDKKTYPLKARPVNTGKPLNASPSDNRPASGSRPVKCFSYGAPGHVKRDCPKIPF